MSDYATPDARPGESASAGGVALRRPVQRSRPGLIEHLIRRWWLIAVGATVGLIAAGVYLAMATPLYTVTTILSLDRRTGTGGVSPDQFLSAQREQILSTPILTAALDSIDIKQRAQLVGFAHSV